MKYVVLLISLIMVSTMTAQVELTPEGIILSPIKTANVTTPVTGLLIVETDGVAALYNGTIWNRLQNQIFAESTDRITYAGNKKIGFGVQSPTDHFHINAPLGDDVLRIQYDGTTKFRIFQNGAITMGSNWNDPKPNTMLINTKKTIVNDTLQMRNESLQITENEGITMYNSKGVQTIHIDPDLTGKGRVITNELELTGGSDLSEKFDIQESDHEIMKPGYLVSVSKDVGKLRITNSKRDKTVVGVISGANGIQTGMLMGQEGSLADGDLPVVLAGRAYVYTSNENGPIQPGDLLTSASKPGYAMKVKKLRKAQGAIIGKALSPMNTQEGYVLVLVNLQ